MKLIRLSAIALFLSIASFVSAAQTNDDYGFAQERMLCAEDGIYIISSFEDTDAITAYSYSGTKLWERSFFAKISSWQMLGGRIVVFSKHRAGYATYLTCLDRYSGSMIWQRP